MSGSGDRVRGQAEEVLGGVVGAVGDIAADTSEPSAGDAGHRRTGRAAPVPAGESQPLESGDVVWAEDLADGRAPEAGRPSVR